MTTIVYRYGLKSPTQNGDLVREQMRAAHRYQNRLIELERQRRVSLRELESAHTTDEAEEQARRCAAKLEAALEAVRERRQRAGAALKRSGAKATGARNESAEMRQRVRDARAAMREARRDLSAQRRLVRDLPVVVERRDAINETWLASRRQARAECGVYWGTYQLAEDAAQRAASDTPLWDGDQPQDPRFCAWRGDGAVSAQLVSGAAAGDLDGDDHTQVRLHLGLWDARTGSLGTTPGSRRHGKRGMLSLRVGSEGRNPIWARWPIYVHRPLPADARIQRVTVQVRRSGPHEEWSALFTLRLPDDRARECGEGIVGVDVGWRQTTDGVRVAFVDGADGHAEDLVLEPEILTGFARADSLRATRDQNLDAMRPGLCAWIAEHDAPPWLREATATMAQWRSAARFAALAGRWRGERFAGDEQGYEMLDAWRTQDRHLWGWECGQRDRSQRRRKDQFRRFAARLARRYETLALEKFDLRDIAKRAPTEGEAENETARLNRCRAGVSVLRECLVNAFRRRGGHVVTVAAENTTRICAQCGSAETFDQAAEITHRCQNGHLWDQDANAARNIRARGEQASEAARDAESPTPSESRRARVARLRREKLERMDRSQGGAE